MRNWLVAGALVAGVAFGVHLTGPFVARWQTRRWIRGLDGATGEFLDARFSVFPLVYGVTQLKLDQPRRLQKEPLFYADDVSVQLLWKELFRGHLVTRIHARGVKVVLEQPPEGASGRLPYLPSFITVPVRVDRLVATDSEVLYVWVRMNHRPSLWFHHIEASVENIASRPNLTRGPVTLEASGRVQRSGKMSVAVQAQPFATPLEFRGLAKVEGFDLAEINSLLESQKGIKLTPGHFSMTMSFESKAGQLTGRVEPHLQASGIDSGENVGAALTALLARMTMVFSTPADGTTPSGAILVRDNLTQQDRQLLPSMEKVVENGFLLGIQESLKRRYAGEPTQRVGRTGAAPTDLKTGL
ncbi:MAG: DUF748 domain-containing protein [Myxococcaceae bacterium]